MTGLPKGCLTTIATGAAIIAFALWLLSGNTSTLRSRLTLVVETPEGDRSGSSVSQVTILSPGACNRAIGFGSLSTEGEEGEAVVVDLGARGVLFATLAKESLIRSGGMNMYTAALVPFPQEEFPGEVGKGACSKDSFAAYLDEVRRQKPRGDLPFEYLPVLVRFRDTSDPSTVEQVDPLNLARSFGEGVKLKRASIEITDDPPTKVVESRLPWLARTDDPYHRLIPKPPGPRALHDTSTVELLNYSNFRRDFRR